MAHDTVLIPEATQEGEPAEEAPAPEQSFVAHKSWLPVPTS